MAGAEDCPPTAGNIQLVAEPPSVTGEVDSGEQPRVDGIPTVTETPVEKERQAMPEDGANVRMDAIGRRYKLDNFSNRL